MAQVLSYEFCEISKNTFFIEHLQWLLLSNDKWITSYERISNNEEIGYSQFRIPIVL